MPKADTSVKFFHSGMLDAPVLRGEAGALIELLDACLINGFSTRTPDSIVVADEVATVTISAGNPYEQHAVISITGASVAALNAEWRIATAAASTFTFACPGVADGAATGASVKRAPAGWERPFSASHKAAYRSTDILSTQMSLRVDDADARYARVRGYESMIDIDTGVGLFPTVTQRTSTEYTWPKNYVSGVASVKWALVADGRSINFLPAWYRQNASAQGQHEYLRFGDIYGFYEQDPFACCIAAIPNSSPTFTGNSGTNTERLLTTAGGCYLARDRSGGVTSIQHIHACAVSAAGLGANVSPASDQLVPIYIVDANVMTESTALRGAVRGAFLVFGKRSSDLGYLIDSTADSAVLYVRTGRADEHTVYAYMCFDIKGPWR